MHVISFLLLFYCFDFITLNSRVDCVFAFRFLLFFVHFAVFTQGLPQSFSYFVFIVCYFVLSKFLSAFSCFS